MKFIKNIPIFTSIIITALSSSYAYGQNLNKTPIKQEYENAYKELNQIKVEPERQRGYDRSDWKHWLNLNENCFDARQEVLYTESLENPIVRDCRVISGKWYQAYTGQFETDPGNIDIDHFVPLQEAYNSGGWNWSPKRKAEYANDLTDSRTLIAVSASANRSKGGGDPNEWLPPNQNYLCRYIVDWIGIKYKWQMSMDESERVVTGNILNACANNQIQNIPVQQQEQQTSKRDSSCNIKGNISKNGTKIYHTPQSRWYKNTQINIQDGEQWFCSPQEAENAGWRPAQ